METIKIAYAGESVAMKWDGTQASAPIYLDGVQTQYQTADARHDTARAVRLCARLTWPECGDFDEDSKEWDDLEYGPIDEGT